MSWRTAIGYLGITRREVAALVILTTLSVWLLPTYALSIVVGGIFVYLIPDAVRVTAEFARYARSKPWIPFLLLATVLVIECAAVVTLVGLAAINGIVVLASNGTVRLLPQPIGTVLVSITVLGAASVVRFARGYLRSIREVQG